MRIIIILIYQVQVAALEVQNVRKAISRYGTLPKGARIGAYLESLRQSGIASSQEQNSSSNNGDNKKSSPRSLSPRTNIRSQPQMIRSNSSSGVTVFHGSHPSNSLTQMSTIQNKNLLKNVSESGNNLRTFQSGQNKSAFKSGSPSHTTQSSLAYLEFPPPPTDLPPPAEEFSSPVDENFFIESSILKLKQKLPMSPRNCKKLNVNEEESNKNMDCINLQPSVEEASSRFGVSLRKKELSSDSCNSIIDSKDEKDVSPQRSSISINSPSQGGQSSDAPVLVSPLDSTQSPSSDCGK